MNLSKINDNGENMAQSCLETVVKGIITMSSERAAPGRGCEEEEVRKMTMSPFRGRGFYDLHSEMNRMFDEVLGGMTRGRSGRQQGVQAAEWAPSMDVLEEDGNLVIKAELPGVKQEDVDITVHDRVLTISGQRREDTETERGGYHVRERRRGAFSRSVMLPQDVNEDRIRARYEDGVLEVTVEGAAAVREPKRIQIEGLTSDESSNGETARG
jgi:HSP20 family protein